jgi:hypothetical protein
MTTLTTINDNKQYLANFVTKLKLFHHNPQGACWNIIARVHAWVCWGYNGHMMTFVSRIFAWIPHRETKFILLYGAKHNRIWPLPLGKNSKKPRDQHTWHSIRIELADTCNQQSPIDTTKKASNLVKPTIKCYNKSMPRCLHTLCDKWLTLE